MSNVPQEKSLNSSHDPEVDEKDKDSVVDLPSPDPKTASVPSLVKVQQPGVAKVEALHRVFGPGAYSVWWLYASIVLVSYAYSLDQNTTSNYLPLATSSFGKHAFLGTVNTAESIVTAVGKPVIAKIADVFSRPTAYSIAVLFYVLGYIVIASAQSVYTVAGGTVLYTVGHTGLDLITDIIIADLSPLKWRALMTSLASTPFIINAFVSAEIVNGILAHGGWRWGYGMFAIIMPVITAPAIVVLYWADWRAKNMGTLSFSASPAARRRHEQLIASGHLSPDDPLAADGRERVTFLQRLTSFAEQLDLGGLILIGFAFGLILLPITLARQTGTSGGWRNPSYIAMEVVGVACFFFFILWERFGTNHPLMPRRIMVNKTFLCAVGIDVFYFMSGSLRSAYLSSYVYIVKDFNSRDWVYFNNTQTLALCIFGVFAGFVLRYTHRYKWLQISGLCIRIVGMGLMVHSRGANGSMAELVWTQILIGMGGAFSVVGSRVASQASVPHQDLASVIALLSLWTSLGSAVGSAIGTGIWTSTMRENMRKRLGPDFPETTLLKLYGNLRTIRTYARTTPTRIAVTKAYEETILPMFIAALIISFLPLVCAVLMTNFYLGDTQNAVDGTGIDGRKMADPMNITEEEAEVRRQDPNGRTAGRRWGLGRWRV